MNKPLTMYKRTLANIVTLTLPLMLLISAGEASAQEETLECGIQTTSVYFGNGINTSRASAELTRVIIEDSYKEELEENYPGQGFDFKLAYNPTFGLSADLSEVFLQTASIENRELFAQLNSQQLYQLMSASQQRFDEVADAILDRFRDVITGSPFLELLSLDNRDTLRADVQEAAMQALNSAEFAARVLQADTNETLTQLYRSDLDVGQRVIIIAHSQGNLFARDNVNALLSSNPEYSSSIGTVGVATPSNAQPNDGEYLTADDDLVINALRLATAADTIADNEPLPANWDNDPGMFNDNRDFLKHYFEPSYFNADLTSRMQIDGLFDALVASLSFPESVVSTGAIRVTLEWGAQPDVDLHAYEPDGTHVFYANLNGTSGSLDRDDVTSFGPENYFVPCETVQEGLYGFGVNYFRGSEPEVASLSMILSDGQTASLDIALEFGIGSAGNTPPVVLAVEVEKDELGALVYTVSEGAEANQLIELPALTEVVQVPK